MSLILLAVLPVLLWDKGPETQDLLQRAGIREVAVPGANAQAWKSVSGLRVQPVEERQLVTLPAPALSFDTRTASATRTAWVHSNGWQLLRDPGAKFCYEANGKAAALAAAEAFAYEVESFVRTDAGGLVPFARMLDFIHSIPNHEQKMPARANVGYIDDGTPQSAEFMNMLVRRNLLFQVVRTPDSSLDLTVSLKDPDYPRSDLSNPKLLAEKVRANLGDDKRILRIYGSEIVIGRVVGTAKKGRLFLLNYGAARHTVPGLHIRVRGSYRTAHAYADEDPDCRLEDVKPESEAIEFTLPRLNTIAVVELE